jgi:hypothetical protein
MRSLLRAVAVVAVVVMILACHLSRQKQPQAAPAPERRAHAPAASGPLSACEHGFTMSGTGVPPGFDYPQADGTVAKWVKDPPRDGHRQRGHAYCLFAGLNQPVMGVPAWRRFETATQAFPFQYNLWVVHGPDGSPLEPSAATQPPAQSFTINDSRSLASGKAGDIRNRGPIYTINDKIANDPKYLQCRQPKYDKDRNFLGYTLKDGKLFQSNGDIMIAVVAYNEAAMKYLRKEKLANAETLDGQLPPTATSPPAFGPKMPYESVVIKVMYWPVAGGWYSRTALPVWDWDANRPGSDSDGQYAGYEMQKFWTRAVAISGGEMPPTADVTFLYGVRDKDAKYLLPQNTYKSAPVVALDRFYFKNFSQIEFDLLSPCDQALLHASSYWAYNRPFVGGDSLVMIAMHIMTKEQQEWTFQSAWWHPDALGCPKSDDRCGYQPVNDPSSDSSWRNYMMTTTYGMLQKPKFHNSYVPPHTTDPPQLWPVAYNPYIELAATHPITTNCMNCHHRAAWPPDNPDQKPDRGRASSYLQTTQNFPNVLENFLQINKVFNGLLMADSMWGLSDRAGYPTAIKPVASSEKKTQTGASK